MDFVLTNDVVACYDRAERSQIWDGYRPGHCMKIRGLQTGGGCAMWGFGRLLTISDLKSYGLLHSAPLGGLLGANLTWAYLA